MLRRLLGLVLSLAFGPAPARAGEAYFVLVFGAQRGPLEPKYAHSFATFVKATDCEGGGCVLEHHTISWLPANLDIRVHALRGEPGVNLPLHETLQFALSQGERVALWGPYRIEPELYAKSLAEADKLNSGRVRYKAVDFGYRVFGTVNCIHAVSGTVAPDRRLHKYIPTYGHPASRLITLQFRPYFDGPRETHPWVADALGLSAYPLPERHKSLPPGVFPRLRYR